MKESQKGLISGEQYIFVSTKEQLANQNKD